jgi:acetyl-CoA carboxylase carboxyl transferase subunit alpha
MLQYSVYSVISPEGCASILWRSADKAEAAAEAMGITAERLQKLGLIDEVIAEPLGGAHRNLDLMCETIKNALVAAIGELKALPLDKLIERRREKLAGFGVYGAVS